MLYITERSPQFISGHVRLKGRNGGKYPFKYLEMIDTIFGKADKAIEVCSNSGISDACCVDINPDTKPDFIDDGQTLDQVESNFFDRWRCDPPYNEITARKMYGTELPITGKLLTAGARVIKPSSLMFLLLGPQNYQWCPPGVIRVGWIACTVIPNNELRTLHIFYKLPDQVQLGQTY